MSSNPRAGRKRPPAWTSPLEAAPGAPGKARRPVCAHAAPEAEAPRLSPGAPESLRPAGTHGTISDVSASPFRIGLIQMACSTDPNENLAKAEWRIREAAGRGAQIVCRAGALPLAVLLPRRELPTCSIWPSRSPAPPARASRRLARELKVVDRRLALRAARRRRVSQHRGRHRRGRHRCSGSTARCTSPTIRCTSRSIYFTPGDLGFRCFDTRYGRIAALVCWDQWYPEAARAGGAGRRAGAVLSRPPSAGIPRRRRSTARRSTTPGAPSSARTRSPTASTSRRSTASATKGRRSTGSNSGAARSSPIRSARCSPKASHDQEEILIVECDPRRIEDVRRNWPFLRDRRIDAYQPILNRVSIEGTTETPRRIGLPHARRMGAARSHLDRLAAQSRGLAGPVRARSRGSTAKSCASWRAWSACASWCEIGARNTTPGASCRKSAPTSMPWSFYPCPTESRLDARLRPASS